MYLTHPKSLGCLVSFYRVIDAGRDFWTSVVQPLLFKAVQLGQVTSAHVQSGFEYFQG